MKKQFLTIGLAALLAVVLPQYSSAQTSGEDYDSSQILEEAISQLYETLAVEYVDILEELEELLFDYSDYIEEADDKIQTRMKATLNRLGQGLENESYADSPETLLDDLYEAVNDLRSFENELRSGTAPGNSRSQRVVRNFRRDLTIVAELVEDYSDKQTLKVFESGDFRQYLKNALDDIGIAMLVAGEALKELGRTDARDMPRLPEIVVPAPAQFPEADAEWPNWNYDTGKKHEAGFKFNATGMIDGISSSRPVIISNPIGELRITGWDRDLVEARFDVEIIAKSHKQEKKYADQAELKVDSRIDGYYVKVELPSVNKDDTKILRSVLTVSVPSGNKVECTSSYGKVQITSLSDGLELECSYSSVKVQRIEGRVRIENSMGPVTLRDIDGPLVVENSYAPIEATNCSDGLDIRNSYAPVILAGTSGDLNITNTGQTEVVDHEGSIVIYNSYGTVSIRDVVGDLIATNAYQPLVVDIVDGSAELKNSYSLIQVSEVDGPLMAENNYGRISVTAAHGPITLVNEGGEVDAALDDDFDGKSSISTTRGGIELILHGEPDLTVVAESLNGRIISTWPIDVDRRNDISFGELVLGDGSTVIDLSTDQAEIVITKRR